MRYAEALTSISKALVVYTLQLFVDLFSFKKTTAGDNVRVPAICEKTKLNSQFLPLETQVTCTLNDSLFN